VPNFADRGCHVVSVTDPYGHILAFLDFQDAFKKMAEVLGTVHTHTEGDYFEGGGGHYTQIFHPVAAPVPEIMDGSLYYLYTTIRILSALLRVR
jgi:hypothetical protein